MDTKDNQPMLLSETECNKVRRSVMVLLAQDFDRDLLADQIITTAWEKRLDRVSFRYIKHKCISLYRQRESEQNRNMNFMYVQSKRTDDFEFRELENEATVESAVKCLDSQERKLVWLKFWKSLTLDEISKEEGLSRESIQKKLKVALYKMRIELSS